jgi:hypothetical protein
MTGPQEALTVRDCFAEATEKSPTDQPRPNAPQAVSSRRTLPYFLAVILFAQMLAVLTILTETRLGKFMQGEYNKSQKVEKRKALYFIFNLRIAANG